MCFILPTESFKKLICGTTGSDFVARSSLGQLTQKVTRNDDEASVYMTCSQQTPTTRLSLQNSPRRILWGQNRQLPVRFENEVGCQSNLKRLSQVEQDLIVILKMNQTRKNTNWFYHKSVTSISRGIYRGQHTCKVTHRHPRNTQKNGILSHTHTHTVELFATLL